MHPLVVPDLQRKFELLITRGVFTGKDEIAQELGKSIKTINWWAHGSSARIPGLIPQDSREAVIDIFTRCFPKGTDRAVVARALAATARQFEEDVKSAWTISWDTLLEFHAINDRGRVFTKPGDTSLIEVEAERDTEGPHVALGQWFRIEFQSDLSGDHVFACQRAAGLVGAVPASLDASTGTILLPPLGPDSARRYMRERRDRGAHQFCRPSSDITASLTPCCGVYRQSRHRTGHTRRFDHPHHRYAAQPLAAFFN